MNVTKSQPLTRRIAARPIGVRLAGLGKPPTLREAGVEGGTVGGLRFDVPAATVAA